jgi:predicted O-methyltransferase YrrM
MTTLTSKQVSDVLTHLFADAREKDGELMRRFKAMTPDERERRMARIVDAPAEFYRDMREHYLAIDESFGRLLYMLARARNARTIVEFGTSFGISTIHLAAALRDNGGGRLITTEFEPEKARRARENLEAAGLADLVEIRVGDAMETLHKPFDGPIDVLFLDGAKPLYLPVLKLLLPRIARGAFIAADNTKIKTPYLEFVRDPANGFLSADFGSEDGNEISVKVV